MMNECQEIGVSEMDEIAFDPEEDEIAFEAELERRIKRAHSNMMNIDDYIGASIHTDYQIATLRQQLADTIANRDAGVIELRKWVEGAGFTWCEDETAVFNVTTALGWLRGEVESSHERIAALEAERDELRSALERVMTAVDLGDGDGYHEINALAFLKQLVIQRNEVIKIVTAALKGQGDG